MTPSLRLRTALHSLRWSYGTLARELGLDPSTPRRWAKDEASPPPDEVLDALERRAEAFAAWPLPRKGLHGFADGD